MVIPWEGPFFPTDESRRAAAESLIRILVVDDEPSLTRSVAALLQSKDRLIEDCGSVAETLARLNTRSYDLLIIDYRLPDASGLAVLDWLLSHERRESAIMISGEESMDAAIGALRRSADDFLLKPYSPEQLRRAVTNALLKRQVERNNRIVHQRLQSSEQMHRYMVENSLDLIYTLDAEGRFNYLNQRVESLLGHPRNDLIGKHFSEIVHPEDVDRARFFFAERRTGPRAASNVELRLSRNPYGPEGSDDDGPVNIVLNAMGIYRRADSRAPAHFVGTYGAARNLPALRRRDDDTPALHNGYHDPLTQLPNRELFHDRLNLAITQAKRRKGLIGVMLISIDRFRQINETHGRGDGDTLLRAIALRLRQCLRRGDTLTRHRGDEFIALLPDIGSEPDARAIAEKIQHAFHTPFPIGEHPFVASLSMGIAIHPQDGNSADDLIQHASVAMHQVKGNGGGFSFFSPEMHSSYRTRASLEKELRQAVARNELELHYQPLVSLSQDRISGMEALVRWRHPTHGLVAPSRFIHSAEEAGIIHEISRWVLDTGCAQMAAWRRQFPELRLTTNLSPRDFEHPDLADTVSRALGRHGLPPGSLELEVSESLLCSDVQNIAPCLRGLRELGVGISLDDFGTGYSSLASLQRYGISRLKIDRSFVKDIQNTASQPVISAIVGIARGFDIRLAAEGVERGEQRTALEGLGCDEMQGFLFSRPLDATAAGQLLEGFRPSRLAGHA